jgi:SAM-dependent methyltransferase
VIRPNVEGVGVDISPTMLKAARENFSGDKSIKVVEHNLNNPLLKSKLGTFDIIVTSLAIHHLTHKRKHSIYEEIYSLLNQGGILTHLHIGFMNTSYIQLEIQLPDLPGMNILTGYCQWVLYWLKQIAFVDVDCYWKWLELALLIGMKP